MWCEMTFVEDSESCLNPVTPTLPPPPPSLAPDLGQFVILSRSMQ